MSGCLQLFYNYLQRDRTHGTKRRDCLSQLGLRARWGQPGADQGRIGLDGPKLLVN